jgi:hypothetical protein
MVYVVDTNVLKSFGIGIPPIVSQEFLDYPWITIDQFYKKQLI